MTSLDVRTFADYRAEFLAALPESYVPAIEAERFVAELRDRDPGALADWLDLHAVSIVGQDFSRIRTRERQQISRESSARRFADEAASGQMTPGLWAITFRVDDDDTQKQLRAMTAADHLFVAASYDVDAKRSSMLAAFHRAVAKKVGRRTTEEVFTPEKFLALRESITGEAA